MEKVLILCDNNKNINNVDNYLKSDRYKDLNIVLSSSIDDINNENISSVIYISECQRYNANLENGSIVVVNEAFTNINGEDKRLLSSFSLNYYLTEASEKLNKAISIVNVSSDDSFKDQLYNKYTCLAINKNVYNIFNEALLLNKKVSCLLKIEDDLSTNYSDIIEIVLESLL